VSHPALAPGRVAVVTGAASGIGRAACKRFTALGMKVCLVDTASDQLSDAAAEVADLSRQGADDVLTVTADVGVREELVRLKEAVYRRFGEVALLMNNAVTRIGGGTLQNHAEWRRALEVNLLGVVDGTQLFVPAMLEQNTPCLVVNTGSKQGITNPPGNPAYNVTKAALKTYTEALQHELRNKDGCQITAHLLVPGWTTTRNRAHEPGAWMPEQVIDVLLAALHDGTFYIICPDDEVTPAMDRKRILWAAGDIVDNRPPLSRWHAGYSAEFEKFGE